MSKAYKTYFLSLVAWTRGRVRASLLGTWEVDWRQLALYNQGDIVPMPLTLERLVSAHAVPARVLSVFTQTTESYQGETPWTPHTHNARAVARNAEFNDLV